MTNALFLYSIFDYLNGMWTGAILGGAFVALYYSNKIKKHKCKTVFIDPVYERTKKQLLEAVSKPMCSLTKEQCKKAYEAAHR